MAFVRRSLFTGMLCITGCVPQRSMVPRAPTGPGLHVLFIGNSLTYVNDLPGILEALADSAHEALLETRMVAKPDYSLADHWVDGDARVAIANGGWNVVVLQQGPSSLDESRALLLDYAKAFATPIHGIGARPALYQVWPASDRQGDFPRANESYRIAAGVAAGVLFPVGEAWLAAQRLDASIPLYAFDGLHPSGEGELSRRARYVRDAVRRLAEGIAGDASTPQWLDTGHRAACGADAPSRGGPGDRRGSCSAVVSYRGRAPEARRPA